MGSNKIKWDYGCSCQLPSQRNRGGKGDWTGKQTIYMEINHALTEKRFACPLEIVSSIFRTSIPYCLESKHVMWTEKTTDSGAQSEMAYRIEISFWIEPSTVVDYLLL